MSEAPYAENREALSPFEMSFLDGAVDGNTGAKKRRCFAGGEDVGNFGRVTCGGFDVFRITSINADSGDLLFRAEVFIPRETHFTFTAAPKNPRHTHAIADLVIAHRCAFFDDFASDFESEY